MFLLRSQRYICIKNPIWFWIMHDITTSYIKCETQKYTHQLNTAKPANSKCDRISLVAALLIEHRNQILKPQSGAGTDRDR